MVGVPAVSLIGAVVALVGAAVALCALFLVRSHPSKARTLTVVGAVGFILGCLVVLSPLVT